MLAAKAYSGHETFFKSVSSSTSFYMTVPNAEFRVPSLVVQTHCSFRIPEKSRFGCAALALGCMLHLVGFDQVFSDIECLHPCYIIPYIIKCALIAVDRRKQRTTRQRLQPQVTDVGLRGFMEHLHKFHGHDCAPRQTSCRLDAPYISHCCDLLG